MRAGLWNTPSTALQGTKLESCSPAYSGRPGKHCLESESVALFQQPVRPQLAASPAAKALRRGNSTSFRSCSSFRTVRLCRCRSLRLVAQAASSQSQWAAVQQAAQLVSDGLTSATKALAPLPADFPPGPQGNAALGMLRDPLGFLESTVHLGSLVGLRLGSEAVVLVSDQSAARKIMIEQPSFFAKEGTAFFPGSRLAGNGLLVSDGPVWRRQRQLSNPAFRQAAVSVYSQAMADASQHLVSTTWASGGSRDVYADFNALTLDIVTKVLFGWDVPAEQTRVIVGAIKAAFEYFANQAGIGIPEWLPTPGSREYQDSVQRLDGVVYRLISQRTQELTSAQRHPQCLLDNLVMSRDEEGRPMEARALRDELMTLLVAGQETSAVLLAWTAAFLAFHPHIQAQAAAEVADVLGGAPPAAHNTRNLPFLESVLLETLRLRPPAYLVGRCCTQDIQLCGYSLPAGTTFLISPYLMHRDPNKWDNAHSFQPGRWRGVRPAKPLGCHDLMQGMGHNGSYLPFGAGPRNCIGTGFAVTEVLIVLAAVLQKYTFSPCSTNFPNAAARITLRPEPVWLYLRRR